MTTKDDDVRRRTTTDDDGWTTDDNDDFSDFLKTKSSGHIFFSNLFAPWQETLADARDRDGEEGMWAHFKTILK